MATAGENQGIAEPIVALGASVYGKHPAANVPATPEQLLYDEVRGAAEALLVHPVLDPDQPDPSPGYRFWPVEPMLTEACALLEKCLDVFRRLDSLWVQEASLRLQLLEDEGENTIAPREHEADFRSHKALKDLLEYIDGIRVTQLGVTSPLSVPDHRVAPALAQLISYLNTDKQPDGQPDNATTAFGRKMALTHAMVQLLQEGIRRETVRADETVAARHHEARAARREVESKIRARRASYRWPGGPLDIDGQMRNEVALLASTYLKDAVERCRAIKFGLERIFGHKPEELPTFSKESPNLIGSYVAWARRQASFLSKFSQLDQGYTVTVSFRAPRVTPGLRQELAVFLPREHFASHRFTRIRGVSLSVGCSEPGRTFRATIRVPRYGIYVLASGADSDRLYQGEVPSCVLGRVASRSDWRAPEIGGAVSLMNVSPLGAGPEDAWSILIEPVASEPNAEVTEVTLELSLVGRPVLGGR